MQSTAIQDLGVIDTTPIPAVSSALPATLPSIPPQPTARPSPQPSPQVHNPPTHRSPASSQPPQPTSHSKFVDPAILSFAKSQPQLSVAPSIPGTSALLSKPTPSKVVGSLPLNAPLVVAGGNKPNVTTKDWRAGGPSLLVRDATALPRESRVGVHTEEAPQDAAHAETGSKRKMRRGQKKRNVQSTVEVAPHVHEPPPVMNVEVSRNGNDMSGSMRRGKGWREGPFLQPSPHSLSPAESLGVKKPGPTRRQREEEEEKRQNGWATEEATDIQDLGDFDFEANHKLFDKKQVFEELRQGDTTADEDRLVSHNKAHRPGTYGGKNLHPTENVLSPTVLPKHAGNEPDGSSDADTELNPGNGRSSSRVSLSRSVAPKKQPSRQSSTMMDEKPRALAASLSSDRGLARSITSLSIASGGRKQVPSLATSSPRPDRTLSPQSAISTVRHTGPLSAVARESHFSIVQNFSTCPVLHPVALETLEMETVSRYGLTLNAITESAARSMAEVAMSMFDACEGSRRESRSNPAHGSISSSMTFDRTKVPVIVVLAGNHSTGARAVAAARHLACHKAQVIVSEAQYETAETQDVQMRGQGTILKRMMKAGAAVKRGPWKKALNHIKNLSGPPAVIIDALLAGSTYASLSDAKSGYAPEFQREAREMIEWANRSRAPVLSIACPSGVSGVDGSAPIIEGEPLAVRPDKVLGLGTPMLGLLEAMKNGERWDVSLADTGINLALRAEEAVAFGAQWIVALKFVEADLME